MRLKQWDVSGRIGLAENDYGTTVTALADPAITSAPIGESARKELGQGSRKRRTENEILQRLWKTSLFG